MKPENRTKLSQVITTAWSVTGVIGKPRGCDVIHRQITDKYTHKYPIITVQGLRQTNECIIVRIVNLWATRFIKRSCRVNIFSDQTNLSFGRRPLYSHDHQEPPRPLFTVEIFVFSVTCFPGKQFFKNPCKHSVILKSRLCMKQPICSTYTC